MAEALFHQHCVSQLSYPVEVRSAGIHALIGHPADTSARSLMAELDVDISRHRGEKLNSQLVQWADIILVMTLEQKRYIESHHPTVRGKVFRLLEDEGRDIPDPYRQNMEEFRTVLAFIQQGISEWIEKLS